MRAALLDRLLELCGEECCSGTSSGSNNNSGSSNNNSGSSNNNSGSSNNNSGSSNNNSGSINKNSGSSNNSNSSSSSSSSSSYLACLARLMSWLPLDNRVSLAEVSQYMVKFFTFLLGMGTAQADSHLR
jgi:hypothetical protein